TLAVVGGPSAATGTASVAQSGVEQVVLQPTSSKVESKIARRGRTLVAMSHLTPMVGFTVWPGRRAKGKSQGQSQRLNWRKLADARGLSAVPLVFFPSSTFGDRHVVDSAIGSRRRGRTPILAP